MRNYSHSITIDENKRILTIHRVFADGRVEFYTSVEMPQINSEIEQNKFEEFAKQLGENILIDSPAARKLLNL